MPGYAGCILHTEGTLRAALALLAKPASTQKEPVRKKVSKLTGDSRQPAFCPLWEESRKQRLPAGEGLSWIPWTRGPALPSWPHLASNCTSLSPRPSDSSPSSGSTPASGCSSPNDSEHGPNPVLGSEVRPRRLGSAFSAGGPDLAGPPLGGLWVSWGRRAPGGVLGPVTRPCSPRQALLGPRLRLQETSLAPLGLPTVSLLPAITLGLPAPVRVSG